ncbi:MAG: N-acylneuraminate cytidylyltransferase [Anaerolineales bacterium]|nr:MAG: N-acylneuraminate cytidylyltransferase [Anaerolineales bacterium]
MDSMVEVLALIPARGGSKGIPGKNIKLLGGYPLIAYSIAAALQANLITRTIVSTDDNLIADLALKYGAEVPFLRPEEFARDDTRDLPVFQHALKWLADQEGYNPDVVVQLRPTSPFRPPKLVDNAVQILIDNHRVTSVRGVVPSKQNPYKMWKVLADGKMVSLLDIDFSEAYNMPRQELPLTYWQTGHIDAIRTQTILDGSMSGEEIYPCHIDPQFSVDLDKLLDWQQAESRLASLSPEIILPVGKQSIVPDKISLLVLDFDGVLTDDRVFLNQHGEETVAAHRGDGMGISLLKKAGIEVLILSTEKNPVVQARADKLEIPVYHGIDDKGKKLGEILVEKGLISDQVIYVGNDINDLPCFSLVGFTVAVADAHPSVINKADLVLKKKGGFGAVRELCDMLLGGKTA